MLSRDSQKTGACCSPWSRCSQVLPRMPTPRRLSSEEPYGKMGFFTATVTGLFIPAFVLILPCFCALPPGISVVLSRYDGRRIRLDRYSPHPLFLRSRGPEMCHCSRRQGRLSPDRYLQVSGNLRPDLQTKRLPVETGMNSCSFLLSATYGFEIETTPARMQL